MRYHDNDVTFALGGSYALQNGSYTVTSFSVTEGQDPDGHIYNGLTVTCGKDGVFTFSVGQDSSEPVATWFNGIVTASQNTFNHTADKLNFAFMGTLTLTISGGLLGSTPQTFTFTDVALAQGESGAANNWWFGGSNCTYTSDNQVNCTGTNASHSAVTVSFKRGGNGNSEVDVLA